MLDSHQQIKTANYIDERNDKEMAVGGPGWKNISLRSTRYNAQGFDPHQSFTVRSWWWWDTGCNLMWGMPGSDLRGIWGHAAHLQYGEIFIFRSPGTKLSHYF